MKKFENKQKVVSEWRKLLLELRAEYIHKFMFYSFFFLSVISEARKYSLRLLSPPVRVVQDPTSLYIKRVVSTTRQWIFIWGISRASCFIPKILLDIWPRERHVIIQKDISRYVTCIRINLTCLDLISMVEKCPILIYPYDIYTD